MSRTEDEELENDEPIRITVPLATPSLNKYAYSHWRVRDADKHKWSLVILDAVIAQLGGFEPYLAKGKRRLTIERHGRKQLDVDNLIGGAKSCVIDVLRQYKLIKDDSPDLLEVVGKNAPLEKGKAPHTVLILEDIGDEYETHKGADDRTVYCLLNKATGLLKIGVTNNLQRRVSALSCQSGCKIEVVGTIEGAGLDTEQGLHRMFKDHRVIGEWFKDVPEIRDAFRPVTMDDLRRAVDALILPQI